MARLFHCVRQREHHADCAIATLACLLYPVTYEEVLVAATKLVPHVLTKGLLNDEIIRVAALFGKTLEERGYDEIDFRKMTGILGAKMAATGEDEHAVVLARGLVFDPGTGDVWAAREYLRARKATDIDLLELDD